MGEKKQIGVITRYFHKIGVAAIMLEDTLKVGNKVSIEGRPHGGPPEADPGFS